MTNANSDDAAASPGGTGAAPMATMRGRDQDPAGPARSDRSGGRVDNLDGAQPDSTARLNEHIRATQERMDDVIDTYTPEMEPGDWETIATFVRESVRASQVRDDTNLRLVLLIVSRHVRWAHLIAGLPLDAEAIFSMDAIEESVLSQKGTYSQGTLSNYRSLLYAVTRGVLGERAAPRRYRPIPRARPLHKYTAAELIHLRGWAEGQTTIHRRRAARILLEGGLGAGLTSGELTQATVSDVVIDGDRTLIRVAKGNVRLVPVFTDWADALREAAAASHDLDRFLFLPDRQEAHRLVVSRFLQQTNGYGARPMLQRLRVTWLVRHLEIGTPPRLLMAISGLSTFSSLGIYVQELPKPSDDQIRALCALRLS